MIRIKLFLILCFSSLAAASQTAYFVDGYHGGVWGHYPEGYTSYIVEQLNKHPDWKINLEIEPETWDRAARLDNPGYKALKEFLKDTSENRRVEYVNPAYAQPYFFNISGESIIRQFSYGMKKLKSHFPSLTFQTYSTEEPCFTSSLPQILGSFGFKYASLKNPNTCWGGYTRAFGGELVNWIGPDGTSILTVPRYEIEELKPHSTWETIANANSKEFIAKAFDYGIRSPIGMCLQDAGWRNGPWLKGDFYRPTVYTTWSNYFENIASRKNAKDWRFGQEDILTSLVWGSQVLQNIAREVRAAENNLVQTEKIASINKFDSKAGYPEKELDWAWRNLMLAQHHDCWIVPYNGKKGNTWADKVKTWTEAANNSCDSVKALNLGGIANESEYINVYNTAGHVRTGWVKALLPKKYGSKAFIITDGNNKEVPSQKLSDGESVLFKAAVPAFGYAVYKIQNTAEKPEGRGAGVVFASNGDCILETDLYKIHIDKKHGGTIKSLVAKSVEGKDFVDNRSERRFNELRGNFYKKGGFLSSAQNPAEISVLENGPYFLKVKIEGTIAGSPFSQTISLVQGQRRIDFDLKIDWKGNEGVGEFEETDFKPTNLRKAFYNDKYKLLTLFPLALENQKVFKDAPFDVTESSLQNTFFSSWDSIKNNIMLNWVDVLSGDGKYGMALFTDHTTSYAHGKNHPLGLTTQYSGIGLWGRNYSITGPAQIKYSLLPHKGSWQEAGLYSENEHLNEPLYVQAVRSKPSGSKKSYLEIVPHGWVLSSSNFHGDNLYIRIFNAGGKASSGKLKLGFAAKKASFVNLDGSRKGDANLKLPDSGTFEIQMDMRPFEIRNLKISGINP